MIVIGLFFFILEQMLEMITIQLRAFLEAQHKVVKNIIFSLIEPVATRWMWQVAGARRISISTYNIFKYWVFGILEDPYITRIKDKG